MHQQRILDRLIELVQTPPDSETLGKISGLLDQLTGKSEWIDRPRKSCNPSLSYSVSLGTEQFWCLKLQKIRKVNCQL